jgi:hypothetical protein
VRSRLTAVSAHQTRAGALRTVVRDGVSPPLAAAGFERVGQKQRWSRRTSELVHIVAVGYRHGFYDIEFLLGCPPAARILYGKEPADASDPNFALAIGAASDFRRRPRLNGFELRDGMPDDAVTTLAEAARDDSVAIAAWLERFQTRSDLCRHLVETRGKGFRWPTLGMGLVDLTAAALAVLDRSPEAPGLMEAAVAATVSWPDERVDRLRAAV